MEQSPFPEKRKDIQHLTDGTIGVNVDGTIQRVVQLLMSKAIAEGRKQDLYNQTILGNVSFYISHNKISNEAKLSFDKHPKVWNEKEILFELNNMEADIMMNNQAHTDMLDNPFTY